ncbi:GDSL-type esterase/lipase family protein [Lacticigenium naphthae]|uniref:GDSL-type esterase/lipase family protein n=1 Tax=Lacticigenium naphthae TaxID=515351 RepID=UPI000417DFB6|nr:GDSL-type esterase/lipase family protein [Lacticigenium naphthae]
MYKKVIWPLVFFMSLVLATVFISGFIASIVVSKSEETNYPEEQMESSSDRPEEGERIPEDSSDILILGDSIGFGVGDEENLGIGERYLDLINTEDEKERTSTNISVPSFESDDLVNLIKSAENEASIASANLIIVSIGGNDLNRLDYEDNVTLTLAFEKALKKYKGNLEFLIKEIRNLNPDAQLAFIGLYDPYSKKEPEKTRLLLEWNYETRLIVESDVKSAYIPTYELFKYHLDDYLSVDEFHPSGSGYQVIAEELDRVVN